MTDPLILPEPEIERADKAADFWQAAFRAVLPTALNASGWTMDGKKVTTGDQRVKLAALWADHAVSEARERGFLK